jgi:hypothetical protein
VLLPDHSHRCNAGSCDFEFKTAKPFSAIFFNIVHPGIFFNGFFFEATIARIARETMAGSKLPIEGAAKPEYYLFNDGFFTIS